MLFKRQIVLAGPPGAGKSLLARSLADRLGVAAFDLDQEIERHHGSSPAEIIRTQGEDTFRALEAELLERATGTAVVALGGGTLTRRAGYEKARSLGPIIGLTVSPETLERRVAAQGVDRPLLRPMPELLERRKRAYQRVDLSVSAEGSADSIVDTILSRIDELSVLEGRVGTVTTRVLVGRDLAQAIAGAVAMQDPGRPVLLISDRGVPAERRERLVRSLEAVHTTIEIEVPGGEGIKTWAFLGEVLERAVAAGCGRQSSVVGYGGGATCDLAALVAALLGRGAPLVLAPTTLLAQVDAAIGGKCAVNLVGGRNLAGTFFPAETVVVDVDDLESLDPAEYRSGLAEALKIGIIAEPSLFLALAKEPRISAAQLAAAVSKKLEIVERDPTERGERKTLNLGHTLAHGLETAAHYQIKHGEAVAIGMAAVARLGRARGWTTPEVAQQIVDGIESAGLPVFAESELLAKSAPFLHQDKKADDQAVDLIVVRDLGKVEVERLLLRDIAPDLVRHGGRA